MSTIIMCLEGTIRIFRARGDSQMSNMTDACKSLSSKSVGANGCQVLEGFELRGSEALAKNGKIVPLGRLANVCRLNKDQ